MIFVIPFLVLEFGLEVIIILTLIIISVKAIATYVKWSAIDSGEFRYKANQYYVVISREEWGKITEKLLGVNLYNKTELQKLLKILESDTIVPNSEDSQRLARYIKESTGQSYNNGEEIK